MLHPTVSSPDAGGHRTLEQVRNLLTSLVSKTLTYFSENQETHLRLVREHLFELLDSRPVPTGAQNLRSASLLLHKQAAVLQEAFGAALKTSLEEEVAMVLPQIGGRVVRRPDSAEALDGMSLSLIDMQEVERILLLDRVAQRFTGHYEANVSPLALRLGVLLGLETPFLSSNPFRPEVFVRAFMVAWEKSGLDPQATEDLMLALEPGHSLDLAPLYADLNNLLMHAGVEAKTVHRIRKSEAGASSGHAPLDSAPDRVQKAAAERAGDRGKQPDFSRPRSAWASLAPAGQSIIAHAREFLQKLGLRPAPAVADFSESQGAGEISALDWAPSSGHSLPMNYAQADPQFMGYLGGLQADVGAAAMPRGEHGMDPREHNVLRRMRESEQVRRAPELDRGTVDALAEVFDFVFADQSIPVQMKFVIGRLQIPVLKAAMIDRDFFLSGGHPARRLVDTLAQASVAWAPEKGEDDPLYVRIEDTVMRVLHEFEDDLSLFSQLLLEFTEFLFETEQQAQGRIDPVAAHELVGEAYERALAHADEVVHAHIAALPASLPLAPFLAPFLTKPWREVMARDWLSVKTQPEQWERSVACMDQLIWSTQPKTTAEERRELVAMLPELVRRLNAGLDAIDWTGEPRATFTRRLIATHTMAIRMTQSAPGNTVAAELEVSAGKEAIDELDKRRAGQLAGAGDQFDGLAQGFARGLWFDFLREDGTHHHCRLSWVSPMRTRLLFTNREGFEAFVRSEREVAALLRHGRLRVIDAEPIVSRALDRILSDDAPHARAA